MNISKSLLSGIIVSALFAVTSGSLAFADDTVCSKEAAAVKEMQPQAQKLSKASTVQSAKDDYARPLIAGELGSRVLAYAKCLATARHASESLLCPPEKAAVDQAEADYEKIAPTDPAYYSGDDATADFKRIATAESYNRCLSAYASEVPQTPTADAQKASVPVRAPAGGVAK